MVALSRGITKQGYSARISDGTREEHPQGQDPRTHGALPAPGMRAARTCLDSDVMAGLVVLVAVLVAATVFALVRRRSEGRLAPVRDSLPGASTQGTLLTPTDIGAPALGERATLVQFSTAFCQPCRATRRVLDEVAAMVPGVTHVEVDAEQRLDLVRRLDVRRTPTVLVLDRAGRVTRRAAGQPRKADVIAALGEAVDVL